MRETQPGNNVAASSGMRKSQHSRARHLRAASLESEQRKTMELEIGSEGDGDKGSIEEGISPLMEM